MLSEDIILHFAAAKSAMYVYVNGEYVGYSQGAKHLQNLISHRIFIQEVILLPYKCLDGVMPVILRVKTCYV